MDVSFAADHANGDVIDIMNVVAEDEEAIDIAVEGEGFAGSGLAVTDFVVGNDDVGERGGFGAVDRNAHAMGAANPEDVVADDAEMRAAALEHDGGAALGGGSQIAADVEAVYFDIRDVVAEDHMGF